MRIPCLFVSFAVNEPRTLLSRFRVGKQIADELLFAGLGTFCCRLCVEIVACRLPQFGRPDHHRRSSRSNRRQHRAWSYLFAVRAVCCKCLPTFVCSKQDKQRRRIADNRSERRTKREIEAGRGASSLTCMYVKESLWLYDFFFSFRMFWLRYIMIKFNTFYFERSITMWKDVTIIIYDRTGTRDTQTTSSEIER